MKKVWCKQLLKEKNVTLGFVYSCQSDKKLTLKLAASNEFQVFNNGNFVAYGPFRSAHGYSHVRCYSLFPDEKNNICVTVLVCGAQINSYDRVNEQPFFAAEILENDTVLAHSEDFTAYQITDRLQRVQRYSFQRTFSESYRFSEDRNNLIHGKKCTFPTVELYEVKGNILLPECDLSEPDYHFISARKYEQGTAVKDATREVYRDRSLTGIGCSEQFIRFKEEELEEVLSTEAGQIVCRPDNKKDETLFRGRYVAFDLGRNSTGFFSFQAKIYKPTTLYLLFDEIVTQKENEGLFIDINRLQCCNAIKYIFQKGEYSVLSFAPYTAKYIRIAVLDGEINIHNFGMVTFENPDDRFIFSCKDSDLMQVIDAARATFRQNAVDILTDCPSRERAGWLCDSYFSAKAEKFLTGDNRVEKNFLETYLLAPDLDFAKGMIPMCYPADHTDGTYIPNWAMWFIIELKDYLDRTNDYIFVNKFKNKVYRIIDFLDKFNNEYGLLENLESWVFLEWSKANEFIAGVNFPGNMMYSFALKCTAEMYKDEKLLQRSEEMKNTLRKLSYNGEFFVDQALRDDSNKLILTQNISETCQYYAFWTGIADKETYPALYKTLLNCFSARDPEKQYPNVYPSNAFIGRLIRMDYLYSQKEYNTVLKEAKNYYLPMAQRTGTLWENLTTVASCNHGFSSYIAYLLINSYNNCCI